MEFPSGFPETFRPQVVAAEASAEIIFRCALIDLRGPAHQAVRLAVFRYIKAVVVAFAQAACRAAIAGACRVDQISPLVDESLRLFVIRTYFDNPSIHRSCGAFDSWSRDVMEAIMRSPEWVEYAGDRMAAAYAQCEISFELTTEQLVAADEIQGVSQPTLASGEPSNALTTSEPAAAQTMSDPRARVEAFVQKVFTETGEHISQADIWRVAGYRDKSVFTRFLQGKAGRGSIVKINSVLALKSDEFLAQAQRRRSIGKYSRRTLNSV
jgi:hypothetical protein